MKIRICGTKEAARIAAQRGGRRPASGGHDVGNHSKQVCAWRALGRTLCDIQLLVFNIGRADFRSKFVEPFTIMIQPSSSNAMGLQEVGLTTSMHMIRAGAALKDVGGIIMILDRIMIAASGAIAAAQPRNCQLKNTRCGHLRGHTWPTDVGGGSLAWGDIYLTICWAEQCRGWHYKVRSLRNLPAVAALALQHQKSAGNWRRCCVHKDSKRFDQLSKCFLNGPR